MKVMKQRNAKIVKSDMPASKMNQKKTTAKTKQIKSKGAISWQLQDGYELRLLDESTGQPLISEWLPKVFGENGRIMPVYSNAEKAAIERLRLHTGDPLILRFGLFIGDQFAGWHVGDQVNTTEFYMRNSAILPEHRNQGLYSAMLKCVKEYVLALGFQVITSRHLATNNAVIIPKLKQGFVMTGMELSDVFGTLVCLRYFANENRRSVLDYRCGLINHEKYREL